MDRDEAHRLLRVGEDGIREWNRRRKAGEQIPELNGANLNGARLNSANLSNANLSGAKLSDAKLSDANLNGARLNGANLNGARLNGARLNGARLNGANLNGANLNGANLSGAKLSDAKLSDANLSDANLNGANLNGANLNGARLNRAKLSDAKLSDAKLSGAHLSGAILDGANLSNANLNGARLIRAELSRANLNGANLGDTHLIGTDLTQANLANTNLTLSRLIRSNLSGATVERALVVDVHIEQLVGLPNPPTVLRLDEKGDAVITGEEAASFFLQPEVVKVVLDRPLRSESLGGYYAYIAECEVKVHWPEGVAYLGGYVEGGQTILSFQAPKASDVVGNLSLLLKPFRLAGAVDFQKMLVSFAGDQAEPMVEAVLARPEVRSLIAERLQRFEGFADAKPSEIRTYGKVVKLEIDPKVVAELQPGAILAPQLTVIEGGQHMSTQHFHGGRYTGCSFGDRNSLTNYFGAVEEATIPEEDIKERLKEARQAIETLDTSDDDKEDLVEQLTKLTAALEEAERDPTRVKRFWDRIQDVAPTVANILSSAASLGTLLSVA